MSLVTVFNTTDRPVTVDAEGREVGGGEWGTADTTSDAAKAALESGGLIRADVPEGKDVNPLATAAAERTARLTERHAALSGMDGKALDGLAAQAGIESGNKTDLVRALAFREDIALPSTGTAAPKES